MRVVVVGAGIIGAAIGDALARRGVDVTVVDARPPGHGASRASAGILAPYVEAGEESALLPLAARSLAMYDEFVGAARARSGRSVEYARVGTVQVALSDGEAAALHEAADWLVRRGIDHRWLDAADLRLQEPSVAATAAGGLFIPSHAFAGVSSLVSALALSARFAGAVFESPVEVSRIVPRRDTVELRAGDRRIDADVAIVACGSWAGRLRVDGVRTPPVRPVRGQLLHLRWPPSDVGLPSSVVWGSGCYAVPWSDGSLLVGATMEEVGFDERTTLGGVAALATAATRLLPAAAQATLLESRAGLRPATPDGLPVVGPSASAPRVWWATGHYRNGILLAPLTASLVERALVDGAFDDALSALTPDRFS